MLQNHLACPNISNTSAPFFPKPNLRVQIFARNLYHVGAKAFLVYMNLLENVLPRLAHSADITKAETTMTQVQN